MKMKSLSQRIDELAIEIKVRKDSLNKLKDILKQLRRMRERQEEKQD